MTTIDLLRPLPGTTRTTPRPTRRWPLFGVAAGVAALTANLLLVAAARWPDAAGDVEHHLAFVLGLVSIGCLLLASTGWKRWADRWAGDDIAARTIPTALAATAAVDLIGVAVTGSTARHLAAGTDEGRLLLDDPFLGASGLDAGLLVGWWATVVAALCVATLAFRRRRMLPRWMGVVSVLAALPPVVLALGAAVPGTSGFVMPVWLVVVSVGMSCSRTVDQRPGTLR